MGLWGGMSLDMRKKEMLAFQGVGKAYGLQNEFRMAGTHGSALLFCGLRLPYELVRASDLS